MWEIVTQRWEEVAKLGGAAGLVASAWKLLPRLYRGLISILSAKGQLEIMKEQTKTREAYLAMLKTEIDDLHRGIATLRKEKGG